jgi:hypothetical protein
VRLKEAEIFVLSSREIPNSSLMNNNRQSLAKRIYEASNIKGEFRLRSAG